MVVRIPERDACQDHMDTQEKTTHSNDVYLTAVPSSHNISSLLLDEASEYNFSKQKNVTKHL